MEENMRIQILYVVRDIMIANMNKTDKVEITIKDVEDAYAAFLAKLEGTPA